MPNLNMLGIKVIDRVASKSNTVLIVSIDNYSRDL